MTVATAADTEVLIGYQVAAEHPEWHYLAEPYSASDLQAVFSQREVIAACDHALATNRQAAEEDRVFLQHWEDAAWQLVTRGHPGEAETMHRQLGEWTDKHLPAARAESGAPAVAAAPVPEPVEARDEPLALPAGESEPPAGWAAPVTEASVPEEPAEVPAGPEVTEPEVTEPPEAEAPPASDTAVMTQVIPLHPESTA